MATLPAAPNPNALRNAIIARLGLNPGQVAGFAGNSAFDDEITNYYRAATGAMSNLDLNQARLGSDYERQLADLVLNRDRGRRSLEDMFADRGMISSSNFTDEMSRYLADFGNQQSSLTQNRTRGLEDIARSRNEVLEEFERNRMGTEGNYAQQLQEYLLAQAKPPIVAPTPAPARAPAPAPARRPAVRAPVARQPTVRAPAPTPPRVVTPSVPRVNISPWGGGSKPPAPKKPSSGNRYVRPV